MGRYRERRENFTPVWRFPLIYDLFRGGPWAKYTGNPVMTKGGAEAWDSLGIRDPRMMTEVNSGNMVIEGGNILMYYSGFQSASPHYNRAIGRATSPDGINWTKYGSNPILSAGGEGQWDSFGVQTPCALKIATGSYYMAFSGVGSDWTDWGIGIATSTDGINWTRYGSNPVLASADFNLAGNTILTFPTVIKAASGTWYMLVGGTYAGSPDRFAAYAASSSDGYSWTPINSGDAVFTLAGVTGLKFGNYDNIEASTLMEIEAGQFLLLYNCNNDVDAGKHFIGIAVSADLINWTYYSENPILEPGGSGTWEAHRVETPFIPKQDLGTDELRLWYSGKPTLDGEDDSAIGYAISDQRTV